jgi:metal-responsive CopG/Arc/MetJ family transcriptional regulator
VENRKTMSQSIRVAISLPAPVVKTVDALAGRRGESRSRFIASLLRRIASAKHDREISAEIDALFSDPNVRAEQRETADSFLSISAWCRETR